MSLQPINGGDGMPPEPDWSLTYTDAGDVAFAHEQWGVVLREMRDAQTLAVSNGHMVARLVNFRLVYERAARDIAERGSVMTSSNRNKGQKTNANWAVMRQADEAIRAIEAELGISPLRRNRVGKVTRAKKAPSAAAGYLGAG